MRGLQAAFGVYKQLQAAYERMRAFQQQMERVKMSFFFYPRCKVLNAECYMRTA